MNTNFPPTEKIMATPSIEPTAPLAPSPVDNEKINDESHILLKGKEVVIKVGKRRFIKIK